MKSYPKAEDYVSSFCQLEFVLVVFFGVLHLYDFRFFTVGKHSSATVGVYPPQRRSKRTALQIGSRYACTYVTFPPMLYSITVSIRDKRKAWE